MHRLLAVLLMLTIIIGIAGCDDGDIGETYILSVEVTVGGTVDVAGKGTVTSAEIIQYEYNETTTVELKADYKDGYEFSHWEGDIADCDIKKTSILVDKNMSVRAVFFPLDGDFDGGLGTEDYPYLIETAEQLNNIRNYLDKQFKQTADIDLSDYNQGAGWDPIGELPAGEEPIKGEQYIFSGVFDGDESKIINLTIDSSDDNVGLFSFLEADAVIKNIVLKEVNITGKENVGAITGLNFRGEIINSCVEGSVNGEEAVGLLVGVNEEGNIYNSHVEGDITGMTGIGGLAGANLRGDIKNSYAEGFVSGNEYVGGLVGANKDGIIEASYATSNIEGENGVGGLVGSSSGGTIYSSYAEGEVQGEIGVAGLVGDSHSGTIVDATYATGAVTGDSYVGGLVGSNDSLIKDSYASGDISGECCVGGFVGKNFSDGLIEKAYATGEVMGTENVGKFIGDDESNLAANTCQLIISVEGKGTVAPVAGIYIFAEEKEVELEAIPDKGWEFVEWSGPDGNDVFATEESNIDLGKGKILLDRDNDKKITAVFNESEMVLVQAGTSSNYIIENSDGEEEHLSDITIEDDFYIDKYHVTQAEFEAIMGFNPSGFNDNDHPNLTGDTANRPVEQVSWYDAVMFCNKLSEVEGLDKYYNISNKEYDGDIIEYATVTENEGANGYRLPTAKEHEYAARGGKDGDATTYAGSDDLDKVGWYRENSDAANSFYDGLAGEGNGTMPVGKQGQNELGLYDMSGNVYDWTNTATGSRRSCRGGSWLNSTIYCEISNTGDFDPFNHRNNIIGFRLTRTVPGTG